MNVSTLSYLMSYHQYDVTRMSLFHKTKQQKTNQQQQDPPSDCMFSYLQLYSIDVHVCTSIANNPRMSRNRPANSYLI